MQPQQSNNQNWIWVIAAVAVIAICLCVVALVAMGGAGFLFSRGATSGNGAVPGETTVVMPGPAPSPTPVSATGDLNIGELPDSVTPSVDTDLPMRDRYALAARFYGVEAPPAHSHPPYQLGDVESFFVTNDDLHQTLTVDAELVYIADNVYMWVEQGVNYNMAALVQSADRFSNETVPTNRAYFGQEASPGIDGDTRLHVLHSTELGTWVAGYYGSDSEYPVEIVPYSNEKEMFFININNTPPGSTDYDAVLAHEYQHMIHSHVDVNEDSWINEGLSELAAYLNGFGPSGFSYGFLGDPDLQLNTWPEDGTGEHYGESYLFVQYFLDRFGQDALRTLVANPLNGFDGVEDTLKQIDAGLTNDEMFVDWTVANLVNDPTVGNGQYAYSSIPSLSVSVLDSANNFPYQSGDQQVNQYGTDYLALDAHGAVTVNFDGNEEVSILPTSTHNTDGDPATDDWTVWWSSRGDESNPRLTRTVDLTGSDSATLEFDLWYQIEDLWDYGYVTVSTDGDRWDILETPHTTRDNPEGTAYGPGYTGASSDFGDADENGWLHESIDLSAYAGEQISIRFELITDDAVNLPGMAIDNVCIPEIDWCDNAEADDESWSAEGWVRHNNALAQHFSVQAVVPDGGGSYNVLPISLDAQNHGELTFDNPSQDQSAYLVVSGLTRFTTNPAIYRLEITNN